MLVVSYDQPVGTLRELRLKAPAIADLEKKLIATLLVRPNMRSEAEEFLGKHFAEFSDKVCGILTYIDESTLGFLDKIPKDSTIRLLVSAISGSSATLVKEIDKQRQKRALEIVQITFAKDSVERPLFHERWMADEKVLVEIGTDLKVSSIGAKQHTISVYDVRGYRDRIDNFEWYWKSEELSLSRYFGMRVLKRSL